MIDPATPQMVLRVLTGWLNRREREAIAYLIEENRLLRCQLGTRRLRLTVDGSAHPEGGGRSARTAAADLLADVLEGALGQHRRG